VLNLITKKEAKKKKKQLALLYMLMVQTQNNRFTVKADQDITLLYTGEGVM